MKIPLRKYWLLLRRYLAPQWPRALALALALFGRIALQLLNPQIARRFIDTAAAGGSMATLVQYALLFIGAAVLVQGVGVLTTWLSETVAWNATNALRFDLLKHCLQLDQAYHKAHTTGELIERIDGDVGTLGNFFSQLTVRVLANVLLLVGVLALLFREDWRAGVALTLFAVIGLATLMRLRDIGVPLFKAVREGNAAHYGFLSELLGATEDTNANGAQSYAMQRFHRLVQRWFAARFKANTIGGAGLWIAGIGLFGLGIAVAFAVSAYLWQRHAITIGTVYLIFNYTQLLRGPIEEIRWELGDLQQAEACIDRVREVLETRSALLGGEGAIPRAGAPAVVFQDVSFGYDGQEAVLHNLSFQVQPGHVLGLLGRTGSGKTTIARLLLRLYDPEGGAIYVGGQRLSGTRLSSVRRQIGMVTQDVQLFQATVRDNLTFFNPAIPDKQLLAVLADLGLAPWLEALPKGLDTRLEAGGRSLSAGQAQLLALARAFLADPAVVVLDEASSRLDPATEHLIEQAIDRLLQGRTGVVIAHRLATIGRADEVLILEDGRIVEQGERQALAADPATRLHHLLQTGLEGMNA